MTRCDLYIINIEGSVERREHMSLQVEGLGMPYHFFPAVNGKESSHPLFEKYNAEKRIRLKGRTLVGGQLGCYASHYLLWEKCVKINKPIIVLEDDARIFSENFMSFYDGVDQLSSRFECIRLFESYRKRRKGIKVGQINNLDICKYIKGYMGTIGYYLTPSAAKKFLAGSQEWFLTVDIYMDRFWANKVEYFGVVPACLGFDPKFSSDIDYISEKKKRSIMTKICRELFTTAEAIRRMVWNLRFRLHHFIRSER